MSILKAGSAPAIMSRSRQPLKPRQSHRAGSSLEKARSGSALESGSHGWCSRRPACSSCSPPISTTGRRPSRTKQSGSPSPSMSCRTMTLNLTNEGVTSEMATQLLQQFAQSVTSGAIRTIDLTQTLSPDTPTLVLPEEFGQCAGFSQQEISRYDERGVAWYWNNFTVGEHTGTHFDAPIHWVTGKNLPNNALDTIDPSDFIAPAVVIDISAKCAADSDYLLTVADIEAWEAE